MLDTPMTFLGSMTYLQFLLLFICLPIMLLALAARATSARMRSEALIPLQAFVKAALVLIVLAVVYTTPWDNYLVKHQIWWYGLDRVIAIIGYVPIEEYAFFVLQTVFTCLWGYWCYLSRAKQGQQVLAKAHGLNPWPLSLWLGKQDQSCQVTDCWPTGSSVKDTAANRSLSLGFYGVLAGYLAAFALGLYGLLLADDSWRYLGLILSWAMPIALVQWWLGGEHLLANRRFAALMFWPPTLYLWCADALAIRWQIWTISEQFTLGLKAGPLPLEEAVFFAVTNLMVTQGLVLFVLMLPFGQRSPSALAPSDLRSSFPLSAEPDPLANPSSSSSSSSFSNRGIQS